MVFDNIDRDVQSDKEDTQAYSFTSFLPAADHSSLLIITRLPSLGEIGESTEVTRLRLDQALEPLSDRSGLHPSSSGTRDFPFEYNSTSWQRRRLVCVITEREHSDDVDDLLQPRPRQQADGGQVVAAIGIFGSSRYLV